MNMYHNNLIKTCVGFADINSGLEWLSLEKTCGLSPIDAQRHYANFRLASTDELNRLFNALFQTSSSNQELLEYCKCSLLVDLFEKTFHIAEKGPGIRGFIYQDPGDIESPGIKEISIDYNSQTGYFRAADYSSPLSGAAHRDDIGTFLVR
jgi:hypothetical protein